MNCGIGRRSERAEQQKHVLLLNELAHLFKGLRRTVSIIAAKEADLTTIYAALFVEQVEIGRFGFADDAVSGGWSAVWDKLLPSMLLLFHAPFLFGYAKPVPVNFRALRSP